jgi:hypothetical protein
MTGSGCHPERRVLVGEKPDVGFDPQCVPFDANEKVANCFGIAEGPPLVMGAPAEWFHRRFLLGSGVAVADEDDPDGERKGGV